MRRLSSWLKRFLAGFLSNLAVSHWDLALLCALKCSDKAIFPAKFVIIITKLIKKSFSKSIKMTDSDDEDVEAADFMSAPEIWTPFSQSAHFLCSKNLLFIKMYIFSLWKRDNRNQRTRKPINKYSNSKIWSFKRKSRNYLEGLTFFTFKVEVTKSGAVRAMGGLAPPFFEWWAESVSRRHIALYFSVQ